MPRPHWKGILDLNNRDLKRRFLGWVGRLTGDYEISVEPRRMTRRQRANNYYWVAVCTPFAEFLSEQDEKVYTKDDAHLLIKSRILPIRTVVCPKTGEVIGELPSDTHTMTIGEFQDFVERARAWLSKTFELETFDPDERDFADAGKKETVKS